MSGSTSPMSDATLKRKELPLAPDRGSAKHTKTEETKPLNEERKKEVSQEDSLASAFYENGLLYFKEGANQDFRAAKKLFDEAAQAGSVDALVKLGDLYRHGYGVRYDFEKATEYYQLAKEKKGLSEQEYEDRISACPEEKLEESGVSTIPFNQFEIIKLLKCGRDSEVYLADWFLPDGNVMPVAVKKIDPSDFHQQEEVTLKQHRLHYLKNECDAAVVIVKDHDCFIKYFGVSCNRDNREANHYYIIMEYAVHGTFRQALSAQKLSLKQCHEILIQVAKGMSFLHQKNISHGDLLPENVILDKNFNAKIIDFSEYGDELWHDISFFIDEFVSFVLSNLEKLKEDFSDPNNNSQIKIKLEALVAALSVASGQTDLPYHPKSAERIVDFLTNKSSSLDLIHEEDVSEGFGQSMGLFASSQMDTSDLSSSSSSTQGASFEPSNGDYLFSSTLK